ncbi:MAG: hypothetical protein KF788_09330 [Piscinibacter sp.]|nr:hypothetical protein [Piscinibacter sp.]
MQTLARAFPKAPIAALFSLVALAACGGGGAAAPAPVPAPGQGQGAPAPAPAPTGAFTLTLSTDRTLVIQGHSAEITATVTRHNGFDGAVLVTLQNLPAGVTAAPVLIPQGATSAPVTLVAAASAAHSLPTAGRADGSAGSDADSKPLTVTVGGAPGVVDTSFNGGAQLLSVAEGEDYATAMAVQADGKVITVGWTTTNAGGTDIALVRHTRDGVLDTTFGNGGRVVTAVAAGRGSDEAYAVAVQADGRIVVAGSTAVGSGDQDFVLLRYLADGSLDAGFGTGGKVVTALGASVDRINAIAIQADGKIVVGGESDRGSAATGIDFALARYQPNGTLDAGFGNGGTVVTPIRAQAARDSIYAITLQPVGAEQRIVAVGGEGDFVAARYTAAGALDGAFGNGGKIAGVFGSSTIGAARAVTVAADNKLVLAGQVQNDFALARLNVDGSADAGFGTGGKVVTALSATNWDGATALVRQADGKLLAGGWVYEGNSSSGNFAVARYSADGALDAGFGSAGIAITPVAAPTRSDSGRALVLQSDERVPTVRVLQAGEASDSGYKFALLRYWL